MSKAVNGIAFVAGVSARVIARKLGARKKMLLTRAERFATQVITLL